MQAQCQGPSAQTSKWHQDNFARKIVFPCLIVHRGPLTNHGHTTSTFLSSTKKQCHPGLGGFILVLGGFFHPGLGDFILVLGGFILGFVFGVVSSRFHPGFGRFHHGFGWFHPGFGWIFIMGFVCGVVSSWFWVSSWFLYFPTDHDTKTTVIFSTQATFICHPL